VAGTHITVVVAGEQVETALPATNYTSGTYWRW